MPIEPILARSQSRRPSAIDFARGQSDYPMPIHVLDKRRGEYFQLLQNWRGYGDPKGQPELRAAIAEWITRYGIKADPDSEIIVTHGATGALSKLLKVIASEEETILAPSVRWTAYDQIAYDNRRSLVDFRLTEEFLPDFDDIESKITPRTRAILINSPNNPTGVIYDRETLEMIGDLAREHDLVVLSDEPYAELVFDGSHHSMGAFNDLRDRICVLNSFSKTFAIYGHRIGFMMGPKEIVDEMGKISRPREVNTSSTAQAEAYLLVSSNESDDYIREMISEHRGRRDAAINILGGSQRMKLVPPQGTFFVFLNVGMNDIEFDRVLREKFDVIVMPGSYFGTQGVNYIRIALNLGGQQLETGLRRIVECRETIAT